MHPYSFSRRQTRSVLIGDLKKGGCLIGGDSQIVPQSMITCSTLDTDACVQQTLALSKIGCRLVRITAQSVKHAANLKLIVSRLREKKCWTPIIADIHFKPDAAMEAVKWVEGIRINPGNFADSKKFIIREYSDSDYEKALARIEERFVPLVKECRSRGRALRIGTNHGSLSDRIMNRFGDTPKGMVESALEFAQIARDHDFHNFKFSMKSSNPKVMIACYRLLVSRLEELGEDWNYPIHLGVTEAGEGEDGRIKSAIGIGSLLCDGLGDTIRVSLTEDSPNEIPVCKSLISEISHLTDQTSHPSFPQISYDPFEFSRRCTPEIQLSQNIKAGSNHPPRVVIPRSYSQSLSTISIQDEVRPEGIYEAIDVLEIDPQRDFQNDQNDQTDLHNDLQIDQSDLSKLSSRDFQKDRYDLSSNQLLTVSDEVRLPPIVAFRLLAAQLKKRGLKNPILLKDCLQIPRTLPSELAMIRSSIIIGSLLSDGIGDALLIRNESDPFRAIRLSFNILQASGSRSFKTDYVACPSCGRTLFDLQSVTAKIRKRTEHLKGVKIAIMGCIVNGPGEMADADFGYVGGGVGKVNLYVGKKPVRFNIPECEAVECLIDLIDEHGKWHSPNKERV